MRHRNTSNVNYMNLYVCSIGRGNFVCDMEHDRLIPLYLVAIIIMRTCVGKFTKTLVLGFPLSWFARATRQTRLKGVYNARWFRFCRGHFTLLIVSGTSIFHHYQLPTMLLLSRRWLFALLRKTEANLRVELAQVRVASVVAGGGAGVEAEKQQRLQRRRQGYDFLQLPDVAQQERSSKRRNRWEF